MPSATAIASSTSGRTSDREAPARRRLSARNTSSRGQERRGPALPAGGPPPARRRPRRRPGRRRPTRPGPAPGRTAGSGTGRRRRSGRSTARRPAGRARRRRLAGDLGGLRQVAHGHRPRIDLADREPLVAQHVERRPGIVELPAARLHRRQRAPVPRVATTTAARPYRASSSSSRACSRRLATVAHSANTRPAPIPIDSGTVSAAIASAAARSPSR